ncbi:MAG: hypothetical protein EZS28_008811 [Streblomastix strix]|uniref:Uncharacterized protein n=2 Tax=Streblomastix strix TaxID=222440 RepID=A0A5J4WL36_9EUKA|nr:MAG: hypothetical protein EZS28_008811 [Streblomastix strix]
MRSPGRASSDLYSDFFAREARRAHNIREKEKIADAKCTFKPTIPQSKFLDNISNIPVEDRTFQFALRRDRAISAERIAKQERELKYCTFSPEINPVSRAVMAANDDGKSVYNFLDRQKQLLQRRTELIASGLIPSNVDPQCTFTPDRRATSNIFIPPLSLNTITYTPSFSITQNSKNIFMLTYIDQFNKQAKQERIKNQVNQQECTFQPKIDPVSEAIAAEMVGEKIIGE